MKPVTHYTKSGSLNIAYQVFGEGNIDLVYIPGWVSNIDLMWACPELVHFLGELGKIWRVILFDKRGTGLSDRVVELSTLEERMDDIRAVMDAVGSKKAILFGHSEGGSVSALFAATYPNRVRSLITFGIFAKREYAPDYPWAPTVGERQEVYRMIEEDWGSGKMDLASLAPSKADDRQFMDWLANYFRSGASPSAALALTKMNTQVDIVDILGSIRVPSLIMQRTHDIDVKIEEARFIAERIKGSKLVEFEGRDHLFWVGNTEEVLRTMKEFILRERSESHYEDRLFTVLAARCFTGTSSSIDPKGQIGKLVAQYRGKIIYMVEETFVAVFDGPSKAVHCAIDLIEVLNGIQVPCAMGIHIRELSIQGNHVKTGETREFLEFLMPVAGPDTILISPAVRHLLSGAGLTYREYTPPASSEFPDSRTLFTVADRLERNPNELMVPRSGTKKDSFLESVLQQIEDHAADEQFGVDMLCSELGMSERQLQRKVKAITNKTPNHLITSVRLHRARQMLLRNDWNVSEIAYETGFGSPSYFSKCFKKEFGLTPTTYVEQNN